MSEIEQWLAGLGLDKYSEVFAEAEIDLLTLPHLTEDVLKDLGAASLPSDWFVEDRRIRSDTSASVRAQLDRGWQLLRGHSSAGSLDEAALSRLGSGRRRSYGGRLFTTRESQGMG